MKRHMYQLIWGALLIATGCFPAYQHVQCVEDSNCDLRPGGVCQTNAATGNRWCSHADLACPSGHRYSDLDVGDGVSGTCVPEKVISPIVENGQRADLVLGQEIFTTRDFNDGGLSARSLARPAAVAVDAGRLWVLDLSNERALMWSPEPVTSFAEAGLVVGQPNFTTSECSIRGSSTLCPSAGIAARDGKLLVADQNRVMIWNPGPVASGSPASIVLGQTNFNASAAGSGAADFSSAGGLWTDGTRVVVADRYNNRVLIWTSFPTTNKQPADLVLGQPGFGMSERPDPPTGGSMHDPTSVYSDGVRLFVADRGNNRLLVWRSFPTASGTAADFAIGQQNLTSKENGHGPTQLSSPWGVTTVGDHLFVADAANNRVLVFSPIPTASGATASFVLGQSSFETNLPGTTQDTLSNPLGLVVHGNKLYLADSENHRILRFDLKL